VVLAGFWGVRPFSIMGLIWGTVFVALGGFWELKPFSFMGS
jgi:hypothetical protein